MAKRLPWVVHEPGTITAVADCQDQSDRQLASVRATLASGSLGTACGHRFREPGAEGVGSSANVALGGVLVRVRRLQIERFRGIKSLDWRHIGDTVGLVGPGDSGKSTVLDALERVLSLRWNYPFDDSDFRNLQTDEPLVIRRSGYFTGPT